MLTFYPILSRLLSRRDGWGKVGLAFHSNLLVFSYSEPICTAICLGLSTAVYLVLLWPSPSLHIGPPGYSNLPSSGGLLHFPMNSIAGSGPLRSKLLIESVLCSQPSNLQHKLRGKALTRKAKYQRKSARSAFRSGFVYKIRVRKTLL